MFNKLKIQLIFSGIAGIAACDHVPAGCFTPSK